MAFGNFSQGRYPLKHPEKYLGNASDVVFRSSWELRFMQFLDANPHITKWASEEVKIPYIKPTDGGVHNYFPDFFVQYKDKDGNVRNELIEIKPANQTKLRKKASIKEQVTFAVNKAKWEAAAAWCEQRKIHFRILTETQLFGYNK